MPLFKVQNNVPEVYVNQSRDFQLLCRAYDSIVNGVKFDIDSMLSVINTDECNSRLLPLLQTKLGFISDVPATNDALRYVLKAFPHIVKNKGSLKAIQQAVIVFLKINHIRTPAEIHVTHKDDNEPFVVKIGIQSSILNTTLLDEILKYVLPTGYQVEYLFYTETTHENLKKYTHKQLNYFTHKELEYGK